jgi:protein transport protein SEC24
VSAVVEKSRERRRGVYHPHLYIVKEDGEPALKLWALSCLVQDRADSLPGYQQFVQQLRDRVSHLLSPRDTRGRECSFDVQVNGY